MSDFTKEELTKIKDGLNSSNARTSPDLDKILYKINNLIGNYCDHHYLRMSKMQWHICTDCLNPFNLSKKEQLNND
ncbi:MAG TPA: hypothetical protein ACFYDZ_00285 [Candidatus Brocadiaceae bacterium]